MKFGSVFIFIFAFTAPPSFAVADSCSEVIQQSCARPENQFAEGLSPLSMNNFKARIDEMAPQIKERLLLWIDNEVSDPVQKEKMKNRIQTLTVNADIDCNKMSYSPATHQINFCYEFFQKTPSEYAAVQALAHSQIKKRNALLIAQR